MVKTQRRGAAIVETKKGILVVAWKDKSKGFMIPGGRAEFLETRKKAAIRELYEETRLKAEKAEYIADFIGPVHKNEKGKLQRNHSKIYLIEASGKPIPSSEIKHIAFWTPKSSIKLMKGAKEVLDLYLEKKK